MKVCSPLDSLCDLEMFLFVHFLKEKDAQFACMGQGEGVGQRFLVEWFFWKGFLREH